VVKPYLVATTSVKGFAIQAFVLRVIDALRAVKHPEVVVTRATNLAILEIVLSLFVAPRCASHVNVATVARACSAVRTSTAG